MGIDNSKLLKLKDLYDKIKKSRQESVPVVKSSTPVSSYDKHVNGHSVHVRSYNQTRKEASSPITDVPGPKSHFSKKPEPTQAAGIKPTVPVDKPVSCPMCNDKVGTKTPAQGEKEIFQYMPPKNPFEGKEHNEISLDDVAQGLHRTPLIKHPEFNALTEEEKQKQLKNHAFVHLTPEARTALHREIKKIVRPRFESVGHWMQLHRLGTQYDPETLVDDFADRIIDEMTRHRRANSKFGYKKEEELAKNPPKEGMPPLQFHQGMDTQNVYTGKDIAREARVRTPWWAKRFFFKEAGGKGFEHLIGGEKGPAFQQSQLLGKIYKADRKIDDLKKEAGLSTSDTKIDTSVPYSLQDLQQTAKKAGYILEKETDPNGNLKRVLLFEEDPGVLQTIGEDPKFATPKFEVDFDKGGKINEVRDKLAQIVNPAEGGIDTPLHKFIGIHQQLSETQAKAKELAKQAGILKEKYERFNEDPKVHHTRMSQLASDAVEVIEGLEGKLSGPSQHQLSEAFIGIKSALEYLEDGDFKEAFVELGKAKSASNSIKPSADQVGPIKKLLESIISLTKEAEAYRDKKMINPTEREAKLEKLFDAYKDSEEATDKNNDKIAALSSQLSDFQDDPKVQRYMQLNADKEKLHEQLEQVQPVAEKHWQESLAKLNPEGDEETGDYSDDAQLAKWKEAEKQAYNPESSVDWDEKIPEDFNINDEQQAAGVGLNILDALKDKLHGHEHYIFGGEGHKKGLVHIAHNMLWKLYTNGEVTNKIEQILEKYPKSGGEAPEFYKENKVLHGQNRWRRLHDIDPGIAAKYAVLFSDYNPVPYAETDMYDPKHAELFKDLFNNLTNNGYSLPKDPKVAQWQYYQLFRLLGNHVIGQLIKGKHGQEAIFDKIRSLNKPHTATGDDSTRYPGKLRRTLERRMDALYGRYAKNFPTMWPHNYEKPLSVWLKKIGVQPDEEDYGKSLIIISDKIHKADDLRFIVNRR